MVMKWKTLVEKDVILSRIIYLLDPRKMASHCGRPPMSLYKLYDFLG